MLLVPKETTIVHTVYVQFFNNEQLLKRFVLKRKIIKKFAIATFEAITALTFLKNYLAA